MLGFPREISEKVPSSEKSMHEIVQGVIGATGTQTTGWNYNPYQCPASIEEAMDHRVVSLESSTVQGSSSK